MFKKYLERVLGVSLFHGIERDSIEAMLNWREEGVIDFHLNAFEILDLEALKCMSDL